MSKIGIIFLIISGVFFIFCIFTFIIEKIITNRIYHETDVPEKKEEKKKIAKLNSVKDIDTSLLDEIVDDEEEEL